MSGPQEPPAPTPPQKPENLQAALDKLRTLVTFRERTWAAFLDATARQDDPRCKKLDEHRAFLTRAIDIAHRQLDELLTSLSPDAVIHAICTPRAQETDKSHEHEPEREHEHEREHEPGQDPFHALGAGPEAAPRSP